MVVGGDVVVVEGDCLILGFGSGCWGGSALWQSLEVVNGCYCSFVVVLEVACDDD